MTTRMRDQSRLRLARHEVGWAWAAAIPRLMIVWRAAYRWGMAEKVVEERRAHGSWAGSIVAVSRSCNGLVEPVPAARTDTWSPAAAWL